MFYYAQLDSEGKVHTVCELADEIEGNVVPLDSLDNSLLGKQYNEATGEFEEAPSE